MRRRTRARVAGWLGVVLLGLAAMLAIAPAAGAAAPTGKVRMGHLSPTTGAVDATLTGPEGSSSVSRKVAGGVGYGAVTDYLDLVPGRYVVELRPAGSAPAGPTAVTAGLQITAGSAQSLFFLDTGPLGAVRGDLVTDDLVAPPTDQGEVRLVQGAGDVPPVQVRAVDGPRLATNLQYGNVTDYSAVDARTWDVVLSAGGQTKTVQLPVSGGSVNTIVVTRSGTGELKVTPLSDVAGLGVVVPNDSSGGSGTEKPAKPAPGKRPVPQGGVPAGAGGGAGDGPGGLPLLLALVASPLLVYAVSAGRARRRV